SLRQAIADANENDTIDFSVSGTITLTTGHLEVRKNLTISGPGAANLAVNGNGSSRVFFINSIFVSKIVSISGLTITNGSASGFYPGLYGGGIYNYHATLTLSNCTVSGNSATNDGGGIYNAGQGGSAALTVNNCTLSANSTAAWGGGIFNDALAGSATVTIANSTLSGNWAWAGGAVDLTATGDQINTEPMLGPLQDNGGPTFTHALLPGSVAIDAGDPNFMSPPDYDQRGPGFSRVYNGLLDVGAFEVQPTPTPTPTSTPT